MQTLPEEADRPSERAGQMLPSLLRQAEHRDVAPWHAYNVGPQESPRTHRVFFGGICLLSLV